MVEITGTQLAWGMVILLSVVGITYFIAEGDKAYLCEDKEIVSLCWKLSKLNANDISTRCYYNPNASTTYKICKTGWIPFTDITVTGNLTKIDIEEPYLIQKLEFKDFPELTGEVNITRIWKRLDDENVVIEWEIEMLNRRDNVFEKLRGGFEVPRDQIDNIALVQDILASEIKREFEDYNKTFVPNPVIEYKEHPLWR